MATFTHTKPRIELANLYIMLQRCNPESCSLPFIYYTAMNVKNLTSVATDHDKALTAFNEDKAWEEYNKSRDSLIGGNLETLEKFDTVNAEVVETRKLASKKLHDYLHEDVSIDLIKIPLSQFPVGYNKADFIALTDLVDPEH
jgi:hypothetical protein